MADYFSKYRGRGGPAIEPGIIQMMGSIGDEYAKGIASLGDSISSAIDERREREQAEEAANLWKEILSGPKKIPDKEKHDEAILEEANQDSLFEEQARIAESEVDSAVEESAEMRDRLDTKTYLNPDGYVGRHPLSQVRTIQKDLTKYSDELDNRNEKIVEIRNENSIAQKGIDDIHRALLPTQVRRSTSDDPYSSSFAHTPPRKPTEEEAEKLKRFKEQISRNESRLKRLTKGKNYDNIAAHVEKLRGLKSLEIEIPGSTIGYNRLKQDAEGNWNPVETEKGRIVSERARIFLKQKEDGVFKGGKVASQFLGFNPRYTDESLLAQGVKAEDLERFKTLPQDTLNVKVQEARERYREAQERLEDFRSRPMIRQEDFMRNQTREELVSEVLQKVDVGKLKPNVLPNLASFLDKTKPPSIDVREIAGRMVIVSDPGSTAVTPLSNPHTFANQLSLQRFKLELEKFGNTNSIAAKEYFDKRMDTVDENIRKFEVAKKQGTWSGDDMRPWDEEIDGKALKDLIDKKADIERFYIQRNEGTTAKPAVRKPIKM